MDSTKTSLERAYELARSGVSINDIRKMLKAEGYDPWQVSGRVMTNQLREIIKKARGNANPT